MNEKKLGKTDELTQYLLRIGLIYDEEVQIWSTSNNERINKKSKEKIFKIIASTSKLETGSDELEKKIYDPISYYHLSKSRSNILQPFKESLIGKYVLEIGGKCGSISKYLSENCKELISIDESYENCLINKKRTKSCKNINIICAEINILFRSSFLFDIIYVNGFEEYNYKESFKELNKNYFLQSIFSLLKSNGIIFMTLDNRIGHKSFFPNRDIAFNNKFSGYDNLKKIKSGNFLDKRDLISLLNKNGISEFLTLGVFPDWRYANFIITDRGSIEKNFNPKSLILNAMTKDPVLGNHENIKSLNYTLRKYNSFKSHNLINFSGSFLTIISKQKNDLLISMNNTLGYYIRSDGPNRVSKKLTFIINKNSEIEVLEERLEKYDKTINRKIESTKYLNGQSIEDKFLNFMLEDVSQDISFEQLLNYFNLFSLNYKKALIQILKINSININKIIDKKFIDLIPKNILIDDSSVENYIAIDLEWFSTVDLQIGFLVYRGILSFIVNVKRFGIKIDDNKIIDLLKLSFNTISSEDLTNELIMHYESMEKVFQNSLIEDKTCFNNKNSKSSYIDPQRKTGSQKESPEIKITPYLIEVKGYQFFNINRETKEIIINHKYQKFKRLSKIFKSYSINHNCRIIADIGCNSGLAGLIALSSGFDKVFCFDHDVQYLEIVDLITKVLNLNGRLISFEFNFGDSLDKFIKNKKIDIIYCGALIHWIFNLTSSFHDFSKIISYLINFTDKFLLIEWVDPEDDAIKIFNHIKRNKSSIDEEYNIVNFENAIKSYGVIWNKIEIDGPHRILYTIKPN